MASFDSLRTSFYIQNYRHLIPLLTYRVENGQLSVAYLEIPPYLRLISWSIRMLFHNVFCGPVEELICPRDPKAIQRQICQCSSAKSRTCIRTEPSATPTTRWGVITNQRTGVCKCWKGQAQTIADGPEKVNFPEMVDCLAEGKVTNRWTQEWQVLHLECCISQGTAKRDVIFGVHSQDSEGLHGVRCSLPLDHLPSILT